MTRRTGAWARMAAGLVGGTLLLAAGACVLDRLFPPDLSRLQATGTVVLDRSGRTLSMLPAPGGMWRLRTTAEDVSPLFLDLLVRVEDRHFWIHPGIDPLALARAVGQWVRAGHVVSGASTLSMQAARLLEPRPRTLRSKLIEMFRAVQLEARYGKRGVLGIWLTLAPFGGNLEGVTAASWAWFGEPPAALDPAQAALLVAIPRRPEGLRPDRHAARARFVRDRVLKEGGPLFDTGDAREEPMPTRRLPMSRHAPQAVARLPRAPRVATTLDAPLQVALERLARAQLPALPERVSFAVVIADARAREIRALWSGDWRDAARAGALDLTRAVRSPGSAMKPFIYAMAFADGIAGPETRLADLPHRFGAYAPENFDHGFAGAVTAADALQRSLNLPAVLLLDRVGPLRFAATLRAAGVPLSLPPGVLPSLPLALGGAGVTLRQAVSMYAALADDGSAAPLHLLAGPRPDHVPFLQPAAARSVAAVLTRPFPDGGPPGVAWKTGTSWGGRDAWAIGFDRRHVVGVWIGRPDGTPLPGATGLRLAMPMLARVFGLLPAAPRHMRVPAPARAPLAASSTESLRLLFPPPGAVLALEGPVTIRVMGGQRPITFLVDGHPIPAAAVRREASWTPSGPGFYRLTILDADGLATHATVRVREGDQTP